jgi:predicted site-specific integrase-resolvase
MSEQEAIKRLRELKEKHTLHELVTKLNIQQTTLHRWLKTGKISANMSDLLERRIKEAKL